MDEIDAIGKRRCNQGEVETSDCDRILIELLSQLDGFNELDKVSSVSSSSTNELLLVASFDEHACVL